MAYRFDGVECDTFEELQRLQGAARTTSAVVKETRKQPKVKASARPETRSTSTPKCLGGNGDCGDGRCMNCNKDY